MEFDIIFIEYEVVNNDQVVHTGSCPSFLLNTITDIYCDFQGSKNSINILYNDNKWLIKSPASFDYQSGVPHE